MDFPGGAPTNVFVFDGYSNIYWRIYTDEPLPAEGHVDSDDDNATPGHRHISRLKCLELRLRNMNCIVACCPRRLGLWIFSTSASFDQLQPLRPNAEQDSTKIVVDSSSLRVLASGNTSSRKLIEDLLAESSDSTYGANFQEHINISVSSGDTDEIPSLIYASFILAICGSISLQLTQNQGAIPLGSRTLFTAIETDGYATPIINNDIPFGIASLTTLQAELTSAGKLTISSHTVAQAGITRLQNPWDQQDEVFDAESGTDLWLSPNAAIARLVSASPGISTSFSQNAPGTNDTAKHTQWKLAVLERLRLFGMDTRSAEEEAWVEVEVCVPLSFALPGKTWTAQDGKRQITLKRILWPARYCFLRTKVMPSFSDKGDTTLCALYIEDPLDFAAEWHGMAGSLPTKVDSKSQPVRQQEVAKGQEPSPSRSDFPEGVDSLSRVARYPDLQAASLVYPTPPDGPATIGFSNTSMPDIFGSDQNTELVRPRDGGAGQPSSRPSPNDIFSANVTMNFGPSAGLVVGSGLYDTNDDDDLFGELNETGLGSKEITDADFNFFDDSDFDVVRDSALADDVQAHVQTDSELENSKVQNTASNGSSCGEPLAESPKSHEIPLRIDARDTKTGEADEIVSVDDPMPSSNYEGSQTISPPLSPVEVRKILFPKLGEGYYYNNKKWDRAHYNPVAFDANMTDWDRKYSSSGKFSFLHTSSVKAGKQPDTSSDIPVIGMSFRGRKAKILSEKPLSNCAAVQGDTGRSACSTSASGSDMSDYSDGMVSEDDIGPTATACAKRKRTSANPESVAPVDTPNDVNSRASTEEGGDLAFLETFFSTSSDWSLAGYFSASYGRAPPMLPRREQEIQIAQLLVDQIAFSSLNHSLGDRVSASGLESDVYFLETSLEDVPILNEAERLDLKGFASLEGCDSLTSISETVVSRHIAQQDEVRIGAITKVSPPHLCIRRGKDYLEALPPVISFWETFGLEPAYGQKDISAYCVYPRDAAESADDFMGRLGLLYSNCNLGSHIRGERLTTFEHGLVPWDTKSTGISNYPAMMRSLASLCQELGAALAKSRGDKENIVIYIVNPFAHAAALADICTTFWQLLQKYVGDTGKERAPRLSELVLQIIPLSFLMSTESIVVPSQTEYLRLALEVYSRCSQNGWRSSHLNPTPPVILAESPPKSINFKLSPAELSPLPEESYLHIACSRSLDQRWMAVAWSNNTGSLQRAMSYCLRFRSSTASRTVYEIRREIWAATRDILDKVRTRWKVIIVSTEPPDQEEINTWVLLAEQYNKTGPTPLELTVVNANTVQDLALRLPSLPMSMSIINSQHSFTPAVTPSASWGVPSPDQAASSMTPASGGHVPPNASTLAEQAPEMESESVLTDICDESWTVILSHRLNGSPCISEYRPVLASGYLLRRKGPNDGDGVFSMNVNLVYTQRPPSSYESLLQDTLKMYRDLAALSRARGMYNVQQNTLPWHIATATRGQEMLSYVL